MPDLNAASCGGRFLAAVIVLALAACAHSQAPQRAREEIAAVLDELNDAAAHADEARYFALFAPGGVFLGTDATERWDVEAFRAYAHPHFARGHGWTIRSVRRAVELRGDVAWFDEDLDTANYGPARGSGVLLHTASGWKIAQYNLALTIPNEKMKDVRAALGARTTTQ